MGHTAIIADDAPFMRVMLRDVLEDMDLQVVGEAGDGDEAIELHRATCPDLVFLDVTMPGTGGVDAARRILAERPDATVVMISALGQKDEVLAAIQAGARDFVIKPFEPDRVEATVVRLLARLPYSTSSATTPSGIA